MLKTKLEGLAPERALCVVMPVPKVREVFLWAVELRAKRGEPFTAYSVDRLARKLIRPGLGARVADALDLHPDLERVSRPGGAPGGATRWRRRDAPDTVRTSGR